MPDKPKRGGSRKGSGRPAKYGEPTVNIQIKVPASKADEFKETVKKILDRWTTAK